MVEVLITLFILSIGLLGVASLQFIGSFSNSDALNRSQSVLVLQQFSERLRANAYMSQVGDGMIVDNAYYDDTIYNFKNLSCPDGGSPHACYCVNRPASIPNCRNGDCTPVEMATLDAYEMSCAAVANNPNALVSLSCTDNAVGDADLCSPGSRHDIKILWPIKQWQNQNTVLDSECNTGLTEAHDCVRLELIL
ncbi:pilus assembly protein PilV [Aestuariibacter sp. AA17]|uniref:Pilus assembly protein PilV n=1 Tax=Fluctibacter corallii TaxID=2984329 RepID=A0ABT3A3D1_9ALTE|nr:pilus assembly protein PilV [Aestuariibacter sp. AA17]